MNAITTRAFLVFKFKMMTRVLYGRKRLCESLAPDSRQMVNIGGGLFFRPHWKILDYVSPYYPFARKFIDYDVDLMSEMRFPLADNSVDFFYSAHTLEHIPQEFCPSLLSEVHRCLRPGGAVRLNMPDYDRIRKAADERDGGYFPMVAERGLTFEQAVVEQIATAMLDVADRDQIRRDYETLSPQGFADSYTQRASRTVQKDVGGNHINWFTYDKLSGLMERAGFQEIYRSKPQESKFAELRGEGGWFAKIKGLELDRMLGLDTTWPEKSLYVEGVK